MNCGCDLLKPPWTDTWLRYEIAHSKEKMLRTTALRTTRGIFRRSLGSWAGRFDAARGASLEVRQALGRELHDNDVWQMNQDKEEARAMEAEAGTSSGSQLTFVLSVEDTAVAMIRAALMPTGQTSGGPTGLLIGAMCDPALSLSVVGTPLIRAARNELKLHGCERVMAVAPLTGLCAWVRAEQSWEKLDSSAEGYHPDQPGAVEAVAKGIPRPGHSVLGVGTYKAARPAFERLALEYAQRSVSDPDAEVAMYAASNAAVASINWMHATEQESLLDCAGCTVTMRF